MDCGASRERGSRRWSTGTVSIARDAAVWVMISLPGQRATTPDKRLVFFRGSSDTRSEGPDARASREVMRETFPKEESRPGPLAAGARHGPSSRSKPLRALLYARIDVIPAANAPRFVLE